MKKHLILVVLLSSTVWFVSCDSNIEDILMPTVPEKAIVVGNEANECPATTVVLTATASSATSYVWYNGADKINGATANTYEVIVTGTYSAAGVNAVGEGVKSDAKTVTISICETPSTLTLPEKATIAGYASNICPVTTVVLTALVNGATSYAWYNGATKINGANVSTYTVTTTGSYSVAGVNAAGEGVKSAVRDITIYACEVPAKATVAGNEANECPATTVVLTATATSATSYVWYNGADKINGATANTYEVTTTGAYSVAGLNVNGEGVKSNEKTVNINTCATYTSTTIFNLDESNKEIDWLNAGFSIFDADADGYDWELTIYGAISRSWLYSEGPLTPENYILLPPLSININGKFTFTAESDGWYSYAEKFKIIIGEEGQFTSVDSYRNATVLYTHTMANRGPYTETINIPAAYNGKKVVIGIAHFECTDQSYLMISKIKVEHVDPSDVHN